MTKSLSLPAISELTESADYAFSYATMDPKPETPQSLLVLLHGVGGDEKQLVALGERAPPGTLVVLPRGHRSIAGGRLGWYRIGLSEDGLQIVENEETEARGRLLDFIAQLQSHYDIAPQRTWIGGFSQGGILAASAALSASDRIAGFFMLAGSLLPDVEPDDVERVRGLEALVVHGRDDDTLPVDDARDAASRLEGFGIDTSLVVHNGPHELTDTMVDTASTWLDARLRRP